MIPLLRHAALACLASGCILPDRDIRIESGLANEGAVRIVQRAPMLDEMDALCNADPEDEGFDPTYCPQVRRTRASGLIVPTEGDFCLCPEAEPGTIADRRAIASFEIYAEDGDRDGDADTIYGAALLDPDPADDPQEAAAYPKYWQPGREGEHIDDGHELAGDRTSLPNGRASAGLSVFALDDSSGSGKIDLCNEAGRPLVAGLHTLRFMVTDRPFFRPRVYFEGEPQFDQGGDPVFGNEQWGVPDLAAGATYATIDYVFECRDSSDMEADCLCDEGN